MSEATKILQLDIAANPDHSMYARVNALLDYAKASNQDLDLGYYEVKLSLTSEISAVEAATKALSDLFEGLVDAKKS